MTFSYVIKLFEQQSKNTLNTYFLFRMGPPLPCDDTAMCLVIQSFWIAFVQTCIILCFNPNPNLCFWIKVPFWDQCN